MNLRKIDLAPEDLKSGSNRGGFFKRFLVVFGVIALIFVISLIWSITTSTSSVFHFSIPKAVESIKSTDGRVNVLLLGNGGGLHDGPDLTDSIIVASYNLKLKNVIFFSIPRDLWLDNIKYKINAAYEVGKSGGSGLSFAQDKIDDVLGLPIHYGVRVDFDGFAKAIDLVGGIDVEVEKTFDDWLYPLNGKEDDLCGLTEAEIELSLDEARALSLTPGKKRVLVRADGKAATISADFACRYEHIHFDKGGAHLDGETALKFVRSRHGTNGEGSDFARSKRQQAVIEAFRKKVLSLPTLINPGKIVELLSTFSKSFETDIPKEKFLDFYNLSKNVTSSKSVVLGDLGGSSLFINPSPADYGGAWVLVPRDGDFGKIAEFVHSTLLEQDASPAPVTP